MEELRGTAAETGHYCRGEDCETSALVDEVRDPYFLQSVGIGHYVQSIPMCAVTPRFSLLIS